MAYFGTVLRTEGARGEAITCLLVAVRSGGISDYVDYAKRQDFGLCTSMFYFARDQARVH